MIAPACCWQEVPGSFDLGRLHALNPGRYPQLLESVAHDTPQARYDILFAFPGERLTLDHRGQVTRGPRTLAGRFLDALEADWQESAIGSQADLPFPFHGGWFLFLGYELARDIEPALAGMPGPAAAPVAFAERFPAAVIRDHRRGCVYLVCEHDRDDLLSVMKQDLAVLPQVHAEPPLPLLRAITEEDPELYRARIERTLEYIRAGDTYQVNLSRRWTAEFDAVPAAFALYRRLRCANPAPFAALVTLDAERAILSSSPERLACVRNGRIATRPIAGTYPRAEDERADRTRPAALVHNPKERAEHVMLVDLERNDLGRLCRPGSVRADELLTVESYRHVHHIVSNISGELRDGITPARIIRAVFPGGTITGCPKVRTMQIIAELENAPRGAYTGSVGYLNRDGSLDLNILIRTLVQDGRRMEWRAGGGIVADSNPGRELEETRAKARGLLAVFDAGRPAC